MSEPKQKLGEPVRFQSLCVYLTAWSRGKNPNGQLPSFYMYGCQNDNLNVVRSGICCLLKVCLLNAIDRANFWQIIKVKMGLTAGLYSRNSQ